MKLTVLLESSTRRLVLDIQTRLIDELGDEFSVSVKTPTVKPDEIRAESFIFQVRHKLLKQPVNVILWTYVSGNNEFSIGSHFLVDASRSDAISSVIEVIHERVDFIKIPQWLLARGFIVVPAHNWHDRVHFSILKADKFFKKAISNGMLFVKVGMDSYNNPQHECWVDFPKPRKDDGPFQRRAITFPVKTFDLLVKKVEGFGA